MTAAASEQAANLSRAMATEVRVMMVRTGVRQTELAVLLGLSQGAISHRLNGRTPFDVIELGALADFFGVSPADLLGDARNPRPVTGGLAGYTTTDLNREPAD